MDRRRKKITDWELEHHQYIVEWQLFEQNNMRIHVVHREIRFSEYLAWYEQRTRLHLKPASKEQWTLAYDTGGWRWGFMTSNMAEMFNSLLRGYRSLPVTAIASFTFYKLNAWFVSRKKATMSLWRSNRPWPNLVATELLFSKNKSKR
jgi:hypothetical protein